MPIRPQVVILAAGVGRRLGGSTPKVLSSLWGRTSLEWVARASLGLDPVRIVVVTGPEGRPLEAALSSFAGEIGAGRLRFATQASPRGTGDAVLSARSALSDTDGPIFILNGDCPLITREELVRFAEEHAHCGAAVSVLTARRADPGGYGRVVRGPTGEVLAIVEAKDADAATRGINEVNTGVWAAEFGALADLESVGSANAQQEVYLTDLVATARRRGRRVEAVLAQRPDETDGFNTPQELAAVRAILRQRLVNQHLEAGVEIVDPATTYIDAGVTIAPGARILPCTVIEGDSIIAAGCEVGPFAHLRAGTVLEQGAEVGNFTETKKARLGAGSKAKHLSYLGDVTIGAQANIGAGTITANYDGKAKHATSVGARAFIGSGTVLVAPVTVEAAATTGAGAIVTRHSVVRSGETWVGVPARPLPTSRKDT